MTAQLGFGVTITVARDAGCRDLLAPSIEQDENDPLASRGATHLLVLVKRTFAIPPTTLRFATTLFGSASDERTFIIRMIRTGVAEVVNVDPARAEQVFFASAWQTVLRTLSLDMPVRVWPLSVGLLLATAGALLVTFMRWRGAGAMISGADRSL